MDNILDDLLWERKAGGINGLLLPDVVVGQMANIGLFCYTVSDGRSDSLMWNLSLEWLASRGIYCTIAPTLFILYVLLISN